MEFKQFRLLISCVLMASALVSTPDVFASQKSMSQITRSISDVERALSANESLLKRFEQEREDLIGRRAVSDKPHQIENQIRILNGKIDFLKKDLARTRQRLAVDTEKKAIPPTMESAKVKAAAPRAVSKTKPADPKKSLGKPAKPLPVFIKGYRFREVRRGYMLVWSRSLVNFLSWASLEKHAFAMEAVPHLKVASLPAAKTDARIAALRGVVREKAVWMPSEQLEDRLLPAEDMKSVPLQPLKPENIVAAAATKTAEPDAFKSRYIPTQEQRIDPGQLPFDFGTDASSKKKSKAKTGLEWQIMSRADKEIYMMSVMAHLSRNDVFLMKPYGFYIDKVDGAVESATAMKEEFVHRIVMAVAYENEPDIRKDLDRIRK